MLVSPKWSLRNDWRGNLEWQAVTAARSLAAFGTRSVQLDASCLGRELGQCCGGVVQLWLERFTLSIPAVFCVVRRDGGSSDSLVSIVTEVSGQGVVRRLQEHGGIHRDYDSHSTSDENCGPAGAH